MERENAVEAAENAAVYPFWPFPPFLGWADFVWKGGGQNFRMGAAAAAAVVLTPWAGLWTRPEGG
eukprot:3932425-Rhodomonas_salina.1